MHKPALRSKIVWLDILGVTLVVVGSLAGEEWIKDYPKTTATLGVVYGILVLLARMYTDKPIKGFWRY